MKSITFKCFLEQCKYIVKEKKTSKFVTDDILLQISSDNPDRKNSNEVSFNREN